MSDASPTLSVRLARSAPILVAALIVLDGLHFVFARSLNSFMPPVLASCLVTAVAAVQVGVYAGATGQLRPGTLRHHLRFFLAVGGLAGIATSISYVAVQYIDPGTASLLSESSILFGVLLGVFWLKDRLTTRQGVGVAVALVGVATITFQPGDYLRIGALLVLTFAALYATHAGVVKRYGGHIAFTEFFFWRLAIMAGVMAVTTTAFRAWQWPSAQAWLALLVFALLDVVISRALYYMALRQLNMSVFSIILTLSPVVAILWTWGVFGVAPTLQQLVGGLAVVMGIAVVTTAPLR
ncbi:MAG: DMT family transporter [Anaerolineae bacterium]